MYLWIRRWDNEGNVDEIKKTGRPRRTSRTQDVNIIRQFRETPFLQTRNVAIANNISLTTVRRRLHEAGIHCRKPARKLKLTARHKLQRLQFAERYLNFDFSNVIFADEKTFKSSQHGRITLWRINNTRYQEEHLIENRSSGRISVGLWGWMNKSGPGELIEIGGRLNAEGYKDILQDVLLPTAQIVLPDMAPLHFIHDNCSIHMARVCRAWFRDNADHIVEIPFPPKSPDLNPIENLWGLMVQAWDESTPRTRENLLNHAIEIWEDFRGRDTCANMVNSMRERLQNVIDANGGHTRF